MNYKFLFHLIVGSVINLRMMLRLFINCRQCDEPENDVKPFLLIVGSVMNLRMMLRLFINCRKCD